MSRVVKDNRGFLELLTCCPEHQRQFLLETATPQQMHALVQIIYNDVAKPRALKTFIDGLAELGIDKRLIKNKKILAELMEKERAYRDKDGEASDEEMVSEGSDVEDDRETENSDLVHEGNSKVEFSEESASPEILCQGKGSCYHCNGENIYQTAVVKCPRCHWHDGYKICPICAYKIPVDRKHSTNGFICCTDCHAVKHIDSETFKKSFCIR